MIAAGAGSTMASALVERRRLLAAVDQLEGDARMLGIWAPAGSGKTALLQQWERTLPGTVVIVNADDESAVGHAVARARTAGGGKPLYLLIDRMESASSRTRQVVADVIDSAPSPVRVVLAGRYDPLPPSAARWAVTRELRGADLAFTYEEASAFLTAGGRSLLPAQVEQILQRTGGWAAALTLLRPLLDGHDDDGIIGRFSGDSRSMAEYLVAEFLSWLPPADRDVLVWAAVVRDVPTALAVRVSGRSDAGAVLDKLAGKNLLLTRAGETFSYHPILATFLSAEQRRLNLDRARAGHAAAARWFTDAGDLRGALDQQIAAGDPQGLARFLQVHGYDLIFRGASGPAMRAVRRLLPDDRAVLDADLGALLDVPHFSQTLPTPPSASPVTGHREPEPPAVTRIVNALRMHAESDARGRAALQDLELRVVARSSAEAALLLEIALAWTEPIADDADRVRVCARLVALGADTEATGPLQWLRLLALESALSVTAGGGVWIDLEPVFLAIGRELIANPDPADGVAGRAAFAYSAQLFHRAEPLPRTQLTRLGSPTDTPLEPVMQHIARTLIALDDLERTPGIEELNALTSVMEDALQDWPVSLAYAAVPWTQSALWHSHHPLVDRVLFRCARVLGPDHLETLTVSFLRHPTRDTEHALRTGLEDGADKLSPLSIPSAWVALAVSAARHGRESVVTECLTNALMSAAPMGAVRVFLQEGHAPAALLRERIDRFGAWTAFAQQVLARAHPSGADNSPSGAGLSPRERELLRELPAHQSISDIAARRQVSINTVKSQLRSVYAKLDVQNRADAVSAARRLGLI